MKQATFPTVQVLTLGTDLFCHLGGHVRLFGSSIVLRHVVLAGCAAHYVQQEGPKEKPRCLGHGYLKYGQTSERLRYLKPFIFCAAASTKGHQNPSNPAVPSSTRPKDTPTECSPSQKERTPTAAARSGWCRQCSSHSGHDVYQYSSAKCPSKSCS